MKTYRITVIASTMRSSETIESVEHTYSGEFVNIQHAWEYATEHYDYITSITITRI